MQGKDFYVNAHTGFPILIGQGVNHCALKGFATSTDCDGCEKAMEIQGEVPSARSMEKSEDRRF